MTILALLTNRRFAERSDADGSGSAGTGAPSAPPTSTPTGAPPSSTPSSTPGSGPDSGSSGGADADFESIFFDSGSQDSGADLGLTPTPARQPTPPPTATPSAPAQVAQPQPTQQTPVQPQAPQPQASRAEPGIPQGLDRYDPAQLASALVANEREMVEILATQVLNLSPQEIEALETNVVDAIPRLMARVLVQAQRSALSQMANILPVAIQRHNDVMSKATTAEQAFYKAWPQIDRGKYGQMVYGYASVFRQMYPQATLQDIVRHVGPMVMMAAGIGGQSGGPAVGRAPTPRGNGRSPSPSPFVPAGAGAGPVPGSNRGEMTPWEAMFLQPD